MFSQCCWEGEPESGQPDAACPQTPEDVGKIWWAVLVLGQEPSDHLAHRVHRRAAVLCHFVRTIGVPESRRSDTRPPEVTGTSAMPRYRPGLISCVIRAPGDGLGL